jgi:hypothetical protein
LPRLLRHSNLQAPSRTRAASQGLPSRGAIFRAGPKSEGRGRKGAGQPEAISSTLASLARTSSSRSPICRARSTTAIQSLQQSEFRVMPSLRNVSSLWVADLQARSARQLSASPGGMGVRGMEGTQGRRETTAAIPQMHRPQRRRPRVLPGAAVFLLPPSALQCRPQTSPGHSRPAHV